MPNQIVSRETYTLGYYMRNNGKLEWYEVDTFSGTLMELHNYVQEIQKQYAAQVVARKIS